MILVWMAQLVLKVIMDMMVMMVWMAPRVPKVILVQLVPKVKGV